jgi:hypothetical protein
VHILIAQYDKATLKQVNRVYSGFDVERSDMVDFRVIVGALRMFRKPTESVIYKMRDVVAMFTDDKSRFPFLRFPSNPSISVIPSFGGFLRFLLLASFLPSFLPCPSFYNFIFDSFL